MSGIQRVSLQAPLFLAFFCSELYSSAYVLLLVPYSVTRLVGIGGTVIPFQVVVFAFVSWFALGIPSPALSLILTIYWIVKVLSMLFFCSTRSGSSALPLRQDHQMGNKGIWKVSALQRLSNV